ncbi:MAG: hypothetical protein NTY53_11275, partial [Kiritimatiellaeota bacterium]|nr:hypothetical protein [Kiritimatiellota bacterium]
MEMSSIAGIASLGLASLWLALLPVAAGGSEGHASNAVPGFSCGEIAPIAVVSDGHRSVTKNGVQFDVYFGDGL